MRNRERVPALGGAVTTDRMGGELAGDKLLDVRAVAERLSLGERSVWKRVAAAGLPKPIRIGRSVRWRQSDIAAFIRRGCTMPDGAGDLQ